jgi:hypothetical protein
MKPPQVRGFHFVARRADRLTFLQALTRRPAHIVPSLGAEERCAPHRSRWAQPAGAVFAPIAQYVEPRASGHGVRVEPSHGLEPSTPSLPSRRRAGEGALPASLSVDLCGVAALFDVFLHRTREALRNPVPVPKTCPQAGVALGNDKRDCIRSADLESAASHFQNGTVRAGHRLIHPGVGAVARSVTAAAVPSPSGVGEN